MDDFTEKAIDRGLSILDKAILGVTPDGVITLTEKLVEVAFEKEMTGSEKFEWVLNQIKPMLSWFIRELGEQLVQLVYEIIKESRVK